MFKKMIQTTLSLRALRHVWEWGKLFLEMYYDDDNTPYIHSTSTKIILLTYVFLDGSHNAFSFYY